MYPLLTKEHFDSEAIDVVDGKYLYKKTPVPSSFYNEFETPTSFLNRCDDDKLKKQIVQYCVKKTVNDRISVLSRDGVPTKTVKSRRAVIQFETIENTAREVCEETGFFDEPKIDVLPDTTLRVFLKSKREFQVPVTRKVGDSISAGTILTYSPAHQILFTGYIERLICLNGARTNENIFSWQADADIAQEQIHFIKENFLRAISHLSRFSVKAKQMAGLKISEPAKVLELYAKNMKIPMELLPALLENFEEEPEYTEWGIFNAVTRAATHDARFSGISEKLQLSAGEWVKNYDRVNANVPREIARLF